MEFFLCFLPQFSANRLSTRLCSTMMKSISFFGIYIFNLDKQTCVQV
jgi:hypothetical protein